MRLLVISGAFPPQASGEATNTLHLCENLSRRGFEVDVLTATGSSDPGLAGVRVHPLMDHWSWTDVPKLRRFLKDLNPDAILMMYIGWIYGNHFMMTFAPTIAKQVLPGVRFVTRLENTVGADARKTSASARAIRKLVAHFDRKGPVNYCYGTLLRDSDALVVLSELQVEGLLGEDPRVADKVIVIPPPPNMKISAEGDDVAREQSRARLGLAPDDFAVTFIGYLYPGKGIEWLIKAFQLVAQDRPRAKLIMIGGSIAAQAGHARSYVDELRQLTQELGIADKVTWTGEYRSDTEEASLYLRAADLCVLPFATGVHMNNSSFSSAVSHGLPIVTTHGDFLDRPIRHGENVFLCQPRDHAAIAEGIKTLMDDANLRGRVRSGARELAREWFSWNSAIDRTLEALGTLRPTAVMERARGPHQGTDVVKAG